MTLQNQPNFFQPVIDWDPSARRHGGIETSVDAHNSIKPTKRETYQRILTLARDRGDRGITLHDVAAALGRDRSSVSGRLSELIALGMLRRLTGDQGKLVRRDGCSVLVIA